MDKILIKTCSSANSFFENFNFDHVLPDTSDERILNFIKNNCTNKYVLVIKNDSIPTVDFSQFDNFLDEALEEVVSSNTDIFYLNSWMDRCDQFIETKKSSIYPSNSYVQSFNALGFNSVILKVNAINKIPFEKQLPLGHCINLEIQNNKIKAMSMFPSVLKFDVLNCTTFDSDIYKTSQCREIKSPIPETIFFGYDMVFYWIFIIILIVIITYWIRDNYCMFG